ncbi:unnamed protein product, partial [Musa acuminata subsp. burmannicoides]
PSSSPASHTPSPLFPLQETEVSQPLLLLFLFFFFSSSNAPHLSSVSTCRKQRCCS